MDFMLIPVGGLVTSVVIEFFSIRGQILVHWRAVLLTLSMIGGRYRVSVFNSAQQVVRRCITNGGRKG